ncbi:MAG: LysM peptidoglycan-binding domain-containing protein [Phototrophicaceae bacterium]
MLKRLPSWYWTILLSLFALGVGLLAPTWLFNGADSLPEIEQVIAQNATATETLLPATPLSSPTPRSTLRPAPTLEPPTPTAQPTNPPTATATQAITVNVTVDGIQGLPTATVLSEDVCEVRSDWTLSHEVQVNETLTMIANRFGTTIYELAEGNCLDDVNVIVSGQRLRVPGDAMPVIPEVVCEKFTLLQPINDAYDVPATGSITFNWRGPRAPRYLLRIYPPDYNFNETPDADKWFDYTFDLRQNHTIDLITLEAGGRWYWQAIPLNSNFVQVCPGSPIWTFNKTPLDGED